MPGGKIDISLSGFKDMGEFFADIRVNTIMANIIPHSQVLTASEFVKYVEENPAAMNAIFPSIKFIVADDLSDAELDAYEYSRLPVVDSRWVLGLSDRGYIDASGYKIDALTALMTPGSAALSLLYCSSGKDMVYCTPEFCCVPNSDLVLRTFQKAFVQPFPPLVPSVPTRLTISFELAKYLDKLEPFLGSLPGPIEWHIQSSKMTVDIAYAQHQELEDFKLQSMILAEEAKAKGNFAYAANKADDALESYFEAINHLERIIKLQNVTGKDTVKAKKLLAVCFANRAAAYMLPGEKGRRLEQAWKAGVQSEWMDPSYAKAYIRQVNAMVLLGRKEDAIDVIINAIQRDDLKDHAGLVDRLIDLVTDGKGLPKDGHGMKKWVLHIQLKDERAMAREWHKVEGEWERRINAHVAKLSQRH
ncbi:hypothetical protein BJ165DRAFT_1614896 [Panaeolus papilionaceus]|nr:hypothetical protein BJ165DRAFT_1614896 [Panaeolus papilionaceus]